MLSTLKYSAPATAKVWEKHPDFLVFGVPNKLSVLDPTASVNAQTKFSLSLIFQPLVRINADQMLEPVLAESWQFNDDRTKIVFTLRRGIKFSDGTEVTAEAVAASFRRVCAPESKGFTDMQGLAGCSHHKPKIRVLESHKIEFGMTVHPTIFLYQMASYRAVVTLKKNNKLIGSGPYWLQEHTEGHWVLPRNPLFASVKKMKNSGLIIRYIDENNFEEAIRGGEPDGTLWYRVSAVGKVRDENYRVMEDRPCITQNLVLNNQRFPFDQPIVRQALAAEIYNNKRINECATGTKKAYGIIPVGIGGSISHTAPEKIRAITPAEVFKKVPQLKIKPAKVVIQQHVGRKNICESDQIIAAAKKFNIDLEFKYHDDYSTLWPLYLNHNLDGFVELFVFGNKEAHSVVQFFLSSSAENYANLNDKKLDELIMSGWKADTISSRFAKYRQIAEYMQDNGVTIPLYYIGSSNFIHKCVKGVQDAFYFNPFAHLTTLYRDPGCSARSKKR